MQLYAGGIWKGDNLVADIVELENVDASDIHARRLSAKEVITPNDGENFIIPCADGTVKISGGDQVFPKNPPQCGINPREAKSSVVIFEEVRTDLSQQTTYCP